MGKAHAIQSGRAQQCPARFIPAHQLDEVVWQDLCDVLLHPDSIAQALERAYGGHWTPQELQARREQWRRASARVTSQSDRLTQAYLTAVLPLTEYHRRRLTLEQQLQAGERQVDHLEADARRRLDLAGRAQSVADFCQAFAPEQDVWRLEFKLKREGAKGFRLYAPPEEEDPDEEVEAEMSAEELQHIGTLPRFFARMEELFLHLTRHWLRLVEESVDANRSRWPMHPIWQQLREAFGGLACVPPLDDEKRTLVRGARYRGRMRLLRRMEAGMIRPLEVEDGSPTSAALMTLQRWMERIAEKQVERVTAKRRRYQEQGKPVPAWVRTGMDERFRRVEQVEQRVQMLLGIFTSHGVLPLEFIPAYSVGDLLLQHLDALEQEAEEKGSVQQVLADHFAKIYKVSLPLVT